MPETPPGAPGRPKGFWFGDPRRLRSLALALVVAIASFPVLWFVVLILYALGEGEHGVATLDGPCLLNLLLAGTLP